MMDARLAYALFARRNPDAAPGLILGVTSTGIFCRAGCPARLPKFENCRFFPNTDTAQAAGFRACLRCHPLGHPEDAAIETLMKALDTSEEPLRQSDLARFGLSPSTVRRTFQRRFGTTFARYQRELRLQRAASTLADGELVIAAQVDAGYASASGFRAAYAKAYGTAPSGKPTEPLRMAWVPSSLGPILTLADSSALHLSEFTDRKNLPKQVARIRRLSDRPVVLGRTAITDTYADELERYFEGSLHTFTTPTALNGTAFQQSVWRGLQAIPYATTATYAELAANIGNPRSVRAAASSNAANALALIVPCHRVVPKAGGTGGYAGGPARKAWLLAHESKHAG